eukprot:2439994-Alexandrium_andersonii.AAC.1
MAGSSASGEMAHDDALDPFKQQLAAVSDKYQKALWRRAGLRLALQEVDEEIAALLEEQRVAVEEKMKTERTEGNAEK